MYNLIKNLTTKEEVKKVLRANDAGPSLEKSLTDRWLAEKEAADIAAE